VRPRLTDAAEDDLAGIDAYYRVRSKTAADKVTRGILKAVRGLGKFPRMGRVGHYPGTREHVTATYGYRIVYEIDEDARIIYVLRIMHGVQQWPPAADD